MAAVSDLLARSLTSCPAKSQNLMQDFSKFASIMCAQLTNQCRQLFPPADGDSSKNGGKIAAKPSAEYQGPGQETTLEELGKDDWETVEKPHERAESQSTSVSEEGVKIERYIPIEPRK